jgi:hypothetical protein
LRPAQKVILTLPKFKMTQQFELAARWAHGHERRRFKRERPIFQA